MINFIINVFYKLVSRHQEKGLLVSIWIATFAIGFNLFSFLHVLLGITRLAFYYDVIATPFLFIVFYYAFSGYLEKRFIDTKEFRYIRLPWIFYVVGPVYILISLITFPLTFRFLKA